MRILKSKKAQALLVEYTVVIAVVITALIAVQLFNQRSIQRVIKDSADRIGDQTETDKREGRVGMPVAGFVDGHISQTFNIFTNKDYWIHTSYAGDNRWRQDIQYTGNNSNYSGPYTLEVYGGYEKELSGQYFGPLDGN